MKIAHFIYDSPDNPWVAGGGCLRNLEIYKRFNRKNRIDIFSGDFKGSSERRIQNNIRLAFLGGKTEGYLFSRALYQREARQFLRKHGPEYDLIIEDFSPFSPLYSFNLVPASRLIGQFQNYFGLKQHLRKLKVMGFFTWLAERISLKGFSRAVFSSADLMEMISRHARVRYEKSAVIPYGVSDDLLKAKAVRQKGNYILYLGRLEIIQKGLDLLLEYFSRLNKKRPGLFLKIAGSGKDEGRLKDLISRLGLSSRIELAGRVAGAEKRKLLSEALFVLMPSRYESWGMVSLEAQACGAPVLASDIPGLRQTLLDQKTGFLCAGPEEFLRRSEELLNNRSLLHRMGRRAKIFARRFTWDKLAKAQEAFYKEVLKDSDRRAGHGV